MNSCCFRLQACCRNRTTTAGVLTRTLQVVPAETSRTQPCRADAAQGPQSSGICTKRLTIGMAVALIAERIDSPSRKVSLQMTQAGLGLRLKQQLTLTPRLQQSVKLLQLSALECVQELNQAIAQNPFLEEQAGQRGLAHAKAKKARATRRSSSRAIWIFPRRQRLRQRWRRRRAGLDGVDRFALHAARLAARAVAAARTCASAITRSPISWSMRWMKTVSCVSRSKS